MTTSTAAPAGTLVVSGWSAASPYGLGADAFTAGLAAGDPATHPLPDPAGPYDRAGIVPGFDIRAVLGRKGTRAMDRATALAVATAGLLLDSAGPGLAQDLPDDIGMVLGTGHGSVQSIMDFTRSSLTAEKPIHVDPAHFPNTVMNKAAGQSAIWHRLRGPNTTVAGGAVTGLLALNYAARLLRQGHCEAVLCGAVEEFSAERAWLEYRGRAPHRPAGPLGEGCALFLLESAARARAYGRTAVATVRGARFIAFSEPEGTGPAVVRAVTEVLKEADVRPEDVRLLVPSDCGGVLGGREESALAGVFADGGGRRSVRLRRLIGDTSAASSAFQLAAAVSAARPGELVLVTSVDPDGQVGATVLEAGGAS
ncbi:beta-ketoacyl synthase N-terminal-like domain-containing protein [Streptomyces sp. NBC_01244]|uniref:beta-ketoacyl synthase N-terminal-like domain-containing protein n=1 Tax=Streptomyces sp. NBC_01244 TaxID=2903797 RepID=UPI002E0E9D52|nr:3-oxoacyl-ACP synthase [Streptomyces sp. NBC_01244]